MQIQLAMQGGAGKITEIFTAAEAIQELELEGKINVTRLAGTSAGAIVAALYTMAWSSDPLLRRNLSQIRTDLLSRYGQTKLRSLFPPIGTLKAAYKVYRGQPLYKQTHLQDILKPYLPTTLTFAELARPVFAVTSDLERRQSKTFGGASEESVLRAVIASSALPYVFVTHGTLNTPGVVSITSPQVDGGICDNLPHEQLIDGEEEYGKVFALSFHEEVAADQKLDSSLALAVRILETSMNNAVEKAKKAIGDDYVLEIRTATKSSDFHSVNERFDSDNPTRMATHARARLWMSERVVSSVGKGFDAATEVPGALADPVATMSRTNTVFEAIRSQYPYSIKRCALVITAQSLMTPGHADHVVHSVQLEHEHILAYRMEVNERDGRATRIHTFDAVDSTGKEIPLVSLGAAPRKAGGNQRAVLFVQEKPTGAVTFRKTTWVRDTLDLLQQGKRDFVMLTVSDAAAPVGHADLILHLPRGRTEQVSTFEPSDRRAAEMPEAYQIASGRALSPSELAAEYPAPGGYRTIGWRATNVSPSSLVACVLVPGT